MAVIGADRTSFARQAYGAFAWGFPLFALCCEMIIATLTYYDRIADMLSFALYSYIVIAAAMLAVAVMGLAALVTGRFKRATALLLAPSILALQFIFPIRPLEYRALDLMRFYLTKGHYDAVVENMLPAERPSNVVFFEWGVTDLLDAPSYYWLVYDESGEIALPVEERSRAWKAKVPLEHRLTDERCLTSTYRLSGHYYSIAKHCTYVD